MSIVYVIIGAVLLLDVLWWLTADRLLRKAGFSGRVRVVHSIVLALLFAGLVVVIFSRRSDVGMHIPQVVIAIVYLWYLLILPVLLAAMVLGMVVTLVWWLARTIRRARSAHPPVDPDVAGEAITRRRFLAATAAFAPQLTMFSLTTVAMRQLEQFRTRRFTIPVADLPEALDGLTIAHVTDMHAGRFTKSEVLRQMVPAVNDLRADLVLVTGDLINGSLHEIPEGVETVRQFDAHSGVFMVEGNHDLFEGRHAFESRVRASGIRLLVNEAEQLTVRGHPVQLLGLRWGAPRQIGSRPRSDDAAITESMAELLTQRNPEAFPILLAHHPHAFDPAAEAGLPLTLAGHTHGGQLMLNEETGFGPMMFRYWSGLYTRDASHLVVSNGVGNWFPLRTSAPAELIHLTLRRA
jgi:predicted MPP superfamily phosphohydrolase